MGCRHKTQRRNRVRIKADATVLLDRLLAAHGVDFTDHEIAQIAEMRMRLSPPVGVAAPIRLTRYTKEN